jgi:hypothetical protein
MQSAFAQLKTAGEMGGLNLFSTKPPKNLAGFHRSDIVRAW